MTGPQVSSPNPATSSSPHSPRGLVIVPAFNEAASVADVVAELLAEVPECDVLVVDDGSTDATARCVPAGAILVSLPFNLGIGGAVQTGYRYAARHGYEVAVQVDGDGQHPPREVRKLIEHLRASGADLVIGSRFLPAEPVGPAVPADPQGTDHRTADTGDRKMAGTAGPTQPYRQTPTRMLGIAVLRGLLRVLTGRRITDCTSGFRAAGPRAISAFAHWYPDDYPEPEVVLLLHRAGYRVVEAPVQMRPRTAGRSSISLLQGVFYVIKVSASLLLDMNRQPWPAGKLEAP